MESQQVLKRHEEIIKTIDNLKKEQHEMFQDYFAGLGIKKGTIFTLDSKYEGLHKCIARTSNTYYYLNKKGKINIRDNYKYLWAGTIKEDKITIEDQITEEEFDKLHKESFGY
jgi:hypothetical protein